MSEGKKGGEDQADTAEVPAAAPEGVAPYLIVATGLSAGNIFRLDRDSTIGREVDADIRLLDIDVSRKHARIKVSGLEVVLEDGGSRNGTKVNGRQLSEPCALAEGDTIAIGSASLLKLTFQDGADPKFQQSLQERARRDSMSGAYKRDHFEEHLGNEFAFAQRHKKSLAVVMIDVDRLGALNEKWGRVVADMTLARLARRIVRHLRAEDLFARFDGGTFAVVCRETDSNQAVTLADRLRKCVSQDPYPVVGDAILMTVTVGVGALPEVAAQEPMDIVVAATRALKRAKENGRDRVGAS